MTTPTIEIDLPADHLLRQIMEALEAHPEVRQPLLRVLLTEDFLALPEQVTEVVGRLDHLQGEFEDFRTETRAGFQAVNDRIDTLDRNTQEQFQAVNDRIDEVNRTVNGRIDETNRNMREQFREVNDRIDEVNRTVNGRIDETNRNMREQFQEVNGRIDETNRIMQEQFQEVNDRMNENITMTRSLWGHSGRLRGSSYEDLCRDHIGVILDGWLDGPVVADRERIKTFLLQARRRNEISREEYREGLSPDIIARECDDDDHTGRLAIVEASITFNRDDLEKAARRAAIISRVAGVPTAAFLATHYEWPPEVDAIAQQLGINIIRYESEEHSYE